MTLKGPIHDKNSDVTLSWHKTSVVWSIKPVREGSRRGWAQPRILQTHLHVLLSTCCCMRSLKWSHISLHLMGGKSICFGGTNIFWDSEVTNSEDLLYYLTSYLLHPYNSKHSFFFFCFLIWFNMGHLYPTGCAWNEFYLTIKGNLQD